MTVTHQELIRRKEPMTVAQLIEELQSFNPDSIVVFTSDYGDHSHTEQIHFPNSVDELDDWEGVERTAYSASGYALADLTEEEAEEEDDEDRPDLVIIRS